MFFLHENGVTLIMNNLSSTAGTVVTSFLGPCKNHKLIIDGEATHIVRCPQHLLKKAIFMDNFSYVVENAIHYHHQQFGCSSTSLLAMWHFWNKEYQSILVEESDVSEVIKHSQNIFDDVITFLPQITMSLEQSFYHIYNNEEKTSMLSNSSCCKKLFEPSLRELDDIPTGIGYSSRHYSPSSVKSLEDASKSLEAIKNSEAFKRTISTIVHKLSHDDPESSGIVSELWFQQISFNNHLKFIDDGIFICPLTLSVSYSSVIEGLIIKSKLPVWYDQSIFPDCKSLIIKGSIAFEYTHLGYQSSVDVTKKLNSNELTFSEKDAWIKNCSALLLKLKVNVIFVHGTVDFAFADFCSLHSILLLSNIPMREITALSFATKASPCTYLLDCDYKDVHLNIRVKEWNCSTRFQREDQYILVTMIPSHEMVKLSTVILCHPNPDFLKCKEHQLWHLISRLKLATYINNVLPGGGKTEKKIFQKMSNFFLENDLKVKVNAAIANGFKRYFDFVSEKLEMKDESREEEAWDETQSKTQAWLSAMSLVYLAMQCDSVIVNEFDNLDINESNCNLIGVL